MKAIINKLTSPSKFNDILIALLVGLSTGVGAVFFRYLIKGIEWVGYAWFPQAFSGLGKAYVVIIPAIGGLIVGPMIYFFAREAKGHGVPEVMEAVALRGGRIRPIVVVVKSLASSISIGSGGSVGREGPIVQIGSAIGSVLGQRLNFSEDRIRILVACGAAGGIAATFNAPIAGVIFALEIILGEFGVRHFSNVVISAVAASVIGQAVFGDAPAFIIPFEYGVNSLWEFAFYPILSVLAALWGVLFIRVLYWSEDLFAKWKSVPEWIQPAVGGILLGVLALVYPRLTGITWEGIPQIFNVGYDVIEIALASKLALGMAVAFLILKLIATSLTLGSGGSGGVFAPSLFMGAMLGTAFDLTLRIIFPNIPAPPGAYALIGMAATFTAAAHAPITAVLILFELTGDYRIILPLMLTVVITTVVSQHILKGESIYTLKLTRRGIHINRGRDIDVLEGVLVNEVMSHEFNILSKNDSLATFSDVLNETHSHGAVVLDEDGKLTGLITISDLEKYLSNRPASDLAAVPLDEAATPRAEMLVAYPDESIGQVLYRMGPRGLGRLPVVSREDPDHLLGLVRRQNIIRAYHLALTKRSEISHRARQLEVASEEDLEIVHLVITKGSSADQKTIRELGDKLPAESLLVSINRHGKRIIPRGDTQLFANDRVTVILNGSQASEIHKLFHDQGDKDTI